MYNLIEELVASSAGAGCQSLPPTKVWSLNLSSWTETRPGKASPACDEPSTVTPAVPQHSLPALVYYAFGSMEPLPSTTWALCDGARRGTAAELSLFSPPTCFLEVLDAPRTTLPDFNRIQRFVPPRAGRDRVTSCPISGRVVGWST